jgi:large subunit ribosomal protein L4
VLEDFTLEVPKTKPMAGMVRAIGVGGRKALLLTEQHAPTVVRSCRNLEGFAVLPVAQVSTYDVMKADAVIFTRGALSRLEALWGDA